MRELTRIETVVFLRKVALFSACSAEQILRVSGTVSQESFKGSATEGLQSGTDTPGVIEILSSRSRRQQAQAGEAMS